MFDLEDEWIRKQASRRSISVAEMYRLLQESRVEVARNREWRRRQLQDLLTPLLEKRKEWRTRRHTYVQECTKETRQTISELETELDRIKLALQICKQSLENQETEFKATFETENPLEEEGLINDLQTQMRKL